MKPSLPTRRHPAAPQKENAFTLIELLVVLAVIAVFFAMAAPQITGIIGSNRLTTSGDFVYNKISQAHQLAITENREILVRFYEYADPASPATDAQFRALQFVGWDEDGNFEALTDVLPLESGMIISRNNTLSTLVTDSALGAGSGKVPATDQAEPFVSFTLYPDGSTSLPVRSTSGEVDDNWFLTVVDERKEKADSGTTPKNFYCVQIDPVTGRLTAYRP